LDKVEDKNVNEKLSIKSKKRVSFKDECNKNIIRKS
jgi:hypothetical protein